MNTPPRKPGYTRIRKKNVFSRIHQDTRRQDTPGYNLRGNPPTFKRKPPQTPEGAAQLRCEERVVGPSPYVRRLDFGAWDGREGGPKSTTLPPP